MPWAQAHGAAATRGLGGERAADQHNCSIEPLLDPYLRSQLRLADGECHTAAETVHLLRALVTP